MSKLEKLAGWQQTMVVVLVMTMFCLLLALLAEGAVRIRHYVKHGDFVGVESTYMTDPETGIRVLIPSIDHGGIRTDSLGFRNPELTLPKPPGTVRLAFLGGSTTFGVEVSDNEATWPHLVVERLKHEWPAVQFDYINAGVPGYDTKTSMKNFRARVSKLEPDVVIIYHATNDLTLHSFNQAVAQGVAEKSTDQALSWPSRYSLLWYLVEKNIFVKIQQARAYDTKNKLDVDIERLVAPFESGLSDLGKAVGETAGFVAVATFSHHLRDGQTEQKQATAAVTNLYYMPYMSVPSIITSYAAYNAAIRRVAADLDLYLIEGEYEIPGDSEHFVDSVHFTDTGSRLMAARVAESLIKAPSFDQLVRSKQNAQ